MSLLAWKVAVGNFLFGDFLTGEYFLNVGDMILRVTDKDEVRERHFDGVTISGTTVLTQKYYSPFSETEIDYKPATGKEILCYLVVNGFGGASTSNIFKIWANTTLDSISGGRDVFGKTFSAPGIATTITIPPFILKAGEYLNIERVSGTGGGVKAIKIVGVERDST